MGKENLLFKLDHLEYQYHYANGTLDDFKPRFNTTSKFFKAKGKRTSKRVEEILTNLDKSDLTKKMVTMRIEIFNNKAHHIEKVLKQSILKQFKTDLNNIKSKKKDILQNVEKQFGLEKFVELAVKSKIIKLSISKFQHFQKSLSLDNNDVSKYPTELWFQNLDYWKINSDKTNEYNPSRIWNDVIQKVKNSDQLISTVMNLKKNKELLSNFTSGLDVLLVINRPSKKSAKVDSDSEDSDDENSSSNKRKISEMSLSNEDLDDEELLKQYDGLLAGSDEEEEETNDKSDESDGENTTKRISKKAKVQLPELMAGYYSGGDDESDLSADEIANEQMSNKPQRKNRRGQRARRKIWEKKYGKEAKHVQKEIEKNNAERQQRQIEYEQRVAKRAARALEEEANEKLIQERREFLKSIGKSDKDIKPPATKKPIEEHPSWVAKKVTEEKQKNAKFTGKRITFD